MPDCVRPDLAGKVHIVASVTGYEGEEDVRLYLRRSHRDLLKARSVAGITPRSVRPRGKAMAS
jgi:hypothetical protein